MQEFLDVFTDKVPRLPLKRDVDFMIDVVPGVAPFFKTPYIMTTPEFLELKMQLQRKLEKKYIKPSVSPWGAPVLYVTKKDGTLKLYID